jgi:hypothetical protein
MTPPCDLVPASRQDQDRVVVAEATIRDRLEDIVGHASVAERHGSDVDPSNQLTMPRIQFYVLVEVQVNRRLESRRGRYEQESIEV